MTCNPEGMPLATTPSSGRLFSRCQFWLSVGFQFLCLSVLLGSQKKSAESVATMTFSCDRAKESARVRRLKSGLKGHCRATAAI